ncbi:hypothetical protein [Marinobacter caseinilyticus]|uniref:hypothetical protein n=1 Tax=Marinobacter caseinilyticus TaxID=2692195 RepID=UPI001F2201B1|nr:hypothetical protein [Marinobacter caseinilyticus]
MSERCRQPALCLRLAAFFPALWGRVFCGLLTLMSVGVADASPAPIQTQFSDTQVLVSLPNLASPALAPSQTEDQLATKVRDFLQQARSEGDPRYLGYAQRALERWPETQMTDRLRVLRATLWQSLHRFDEARADLAQVLATGNVNANTIQATLTLANLELVQGHYEAARRACGQLQQHYPGLLALNCQAQVSARTGQALEAYDSLTAAKDNASRLSATDRSWTEGTLGDLAAQLGRPEAELHWRRTLRIAPDDLYVRAQLADWLINQQRFEETLALTEGYEAVDSLAVLRAIALNRAGHDHADDLTMRLRERFAEARWRGNLLHQRDYARFLLDVEGEVSDALTFARQNWQAQREPMDTRLLLRAARANDDNDLLRVTRQWLAQANQQDARFSEDTRP